MHRIKDEAAKARILSWLDYTDEQKEAISKVTHVVFMGMKIPIGDKARITTVEGISKQIDDFGDRFGCLYAIKADGKLLDIERQDVEISR